ncbi:MAG: hypothetical protein WHV67_08430 [Thermoanaerobaculia bacterium]
MINLTCPNCSKTISFEPMKYPAQILSISCPSCKNKISYDNRKKDSLIPIPSEIIRLMPPLKDKSAIIISEREDYLNNLKEGVEELGFYIKRIFKSLEDASIFIGQELPALILVQVENLPPPPFKSLEPLFLLNPNIRRNIYVFIIAPNVKTLDGNSAFLYQVNGLISTQDLNSFHHHIASSIIFEYNLKAHFKK